LRRGNLMSAMSKLGEICEQTRGNVTHQRLVQRVAKLAAMYGARCDGSIQEHELRQWIEVAEGIRDLKQALSKKEIPDPIPLTRRKRRVQGPGVYCIVGERTGVSNG
jgi:hypothetical protein